MNSFTAPTKLGIGTVYLPNLPEARERLYDLVDFVEVTPDGLCHERRGPQGRQMILRPERLAEMEAALSGLPISVHGVELSIGSADGWNDGYVQMLDQLDRRCPFRWHSEHLSFLQSPGGAAGKYSGVPLPLPCTDEALELVAPRAAALQARYGRPFLLENGVHFLPDLSLGGPRDEIAFLNELTERSGCGLLLDLYNLYCNSVNHGFDPREALSRLRMERVVEIHLAGGYTHDGFLLDSHSQEVPEEVWRLLVEILPRATNLAGVVYEILEPMLPFLGVEKVREQLARLRCLAGAATEKEGPPCP